ncbi:MAG: hypothetical protein KDA52_15485 [Planctomycetaceae bacterium]|nr:hypothetical protein [Planctomycetaceae bacterium]
MKSQRSKTIGQTGPPAEQTQSEILIDKAVRLVDTGQLEQAIKVLASSNLNTHAIRNARGVCLMRLGRVADAVQLYRSLVLMQGCTWMNPELPVIYRTNFATSLLLSGRKTGGLEALLEIREPDHPSVVRLREAFQKWEQNLTWGQWLLWKFGVDPKSPVTLAFAPGDFAEPPPEPRRTTGKNQPQQLAA